MHVPLGRVLDRVPPRPTSSAFRVALDSVESWTGALTDSGGTAELEEGPGTAFDPGSILFGKLRPYLAKVWVADRNGAFYGDFIQLKPKFDGDSRYFGYLMRTPEFIDAATGEATGSKMPRTEWDRLRQLDVPVPPDAEAQRQIADYLDRETAEIDAFIADLATLSELARVRLAAQIDRLTAQPSSTDGEGVALSRVLPERVDYRGATPEKVDEGVQLLTARNVKMGWIDYEISQEFVSDADYARVMSRGLPRRGDLLFTMEAPLGNVAIVDHERVALAQRLVKFRAAPDVDPKYICFAMQSASFQDQLRSLATGSTVLGIKASKLNQLRFSVPAKENQLQVARALDEARARTDALRADIDAAIALAKERRAALISAAVTGQIDVAALRKPMVESIQRELEEAR